MEIQDILNPAKRVEGKSPTQLYQIYPLILTALLPTFYNRPLRK